MEMMHNLLHAEVTKPKVNTDDQQTRTIALYLLWGALILIGSE
jgi:hypothetical protein